ncbi:MAG: SprB repeat-containing protein [Flavobacteriia bacterium]
MKARITLSLLAFLSMSLFSNATKLNVQSTMTAPTCKNRNDGSISLFITGGNAPYLVKWQDGSTELNREALTYGLYVYEVSDSKGHCFREELSMVAPEPLSVSFGSDNFLALNGTEALADLQIKGGLPFEEFGYIIRLDGKLVTEKAIVSGPEKQILEIEDASGCKLKFPVLSITERKGCNVSGIQDDALKFQGLPFVLFLIPELKSSLVMEAPAFVSVTSNEMPSPNLGYC